MTIIQDVKDATLVDAIAILETKGDLTDTQRRDLISALNRGATMLHRAPEDITTNAPELRAQLTDVHPVQVGISAKSLANVKANIARALRKAGLMPPDYPKGTETDAWRQFFDTCCNKNQAWFLARLARYCSHHGIEPEMVTEDEIGQLREHLDKTQLTKDPEVLCRSMMETYNAVIRENDLQWKPLEYERKQGYRARPLTEYPESLQADICAYLDRLTRADLFSEDGPAKPLKPSSVKNIEAHIRQFLDALVTTGVDPADLTSLAAAVEIGQIQVALRVIQKRIGSVRPKTLHNISATLLAIARHYIHADPDLINNLSRIKSRLATPNRGMTARNKARLTQFDDWENVVRLVSLPAVLEERANEPERAARAAALDMLHAVALKLLLSCPMRMKNLAALDIEAHLHPFSKGTHTRYKIIIPGTEVKNGEPISFVLNAKASRLLHTYIHRFRPKLGASPGSALFPFQDGQPRDPGNLGASIRKVIDRETGLKVNPHLLRHFAAKLYLSDNPGDYETVRRILGHRRLQTTMDFYAEMANEWALRRFDEEVLSKWSGGDDD